MNQDQNWRPGLSGCGPCAWNEHFLQPFRKPKSFLLSKYS